MSKIIKILEVTFKWGFILIAFGIVLYYLLMIIFTLLIFFNSPSKKLATIKIPHKNYKILVYYIPGNITTNGWIQVKKKQLFKTKTIYNFDRYNYLEKVTVEGDSLIFLIIGDTPVVNSSWVEKTEECDTLTLVLTDTTTLRFFEDTIYSRKCIKIYLK